jgi:hypothetical protein
MVNDTEYRDKVLEEHKITRDQKRKALENDSLDVNARNNANTMVKVRRVAREAQEVLDAQEREGMIEQVHQRYISSYNFSY